MQNMAKTITGVAQPHSAGHMGAFRRPYASRHIASISSWAFKWKLITGSLVR